jgi:hypothetical protein
VPEEDFEKEVTFFADDLKSVGVMKPSTTPRVRGERLYIDLSSGITSLREQLGNNQGKGDPT